MLRQREREEKKKEGETLHRNKGLKNDANWQLVHVSASVKSIVIIGLGFSSCIFPLSPG